MTTCVRKVLRHLKALRQRSALSQEEVARRLGLSRTTYVKKERGQIPITTDEWIRLASALGVKPAAFFEPLEGGRPPGDALALLGLYSSLRAAEQRDLLTLVLIAFKGIRRKRVRECLALLREAGGG